MSKHFTEQQYNELKKLISKHPTLSQAELNKLTGISRRTISLTNTTEDFVEYKKKVRAWNHNSGRGAAQELIPQDCDDESVTQIEQIEIQTDSPEYKAARLLQEFRRSMVDTIDALDQLITLIFKKVI